MLNNSQRIADGKHVSSGTDAPTKNAISLMPLLWVLGQRKGGKTITKAKRRLNVLLHTQTIVQSITDSKLVSSVTDAPTKNTISLTPFY